MATACPLRTCLRSAAYLGRTGVAGLVDRAIAHAQRIAARLSVEEGVEVVNDVVLNQVLVRFTAPGRDSDALTAEVIRRAQDDDTCWLSSSTADGRIVMRVSVCSWLTTAEDVDRSAAAIIRCLKEAIT